ncbi:MAG: PQQ-binding-like beta-propeller repeat protein [Kiritimatiellia bacterium]
MSPDLPKRHRRGRWCCACLLVVTCLDAGRALAQDASTNEYPRAANSVADPDAEVNTWLIRAASAIRAGQPEVAAPLLKNVMQADPAAMASTNGFVFRQARKLAAELIRAMPERTRAACGLAANVPGEFRSGSASAPADLPALEALYRDTPLGAAAREAGLRLAGVYLDQGRFADARRVLLELLDADSARPGPRSELLARLVVACSRVGDGTQAQWAWAELQKESDASRWSALEAEVRAAAAVAASASNVWAMAYGGPERAGAPPVPCRDLATNESWVVAWGVNLDPSWIYNDELDNAVSTNRARGVSRNAVVAEMTRANRRPADGTIFSGNRAWVNRADESVVADLDSGLVLQRVPNTAGSVASYFGSANRLAVAASLIGGRVYRIVDGNNPALRSSGRRGKRITDMPCGNALAAYDTATGKPLWRLGREFPPGVQGKAGDRWRVNAIRFVSSPVSCAGRLLAPVDDGANLGVVALNAESGAAVWRTHVAYGSMEGLPRMTPLTVDGAAVYLCSGKGVVSALDACDGTVLWSALYDSPGETAVTNAPASGKDDAPVADVPPTVGRGWEENLVLAEGNAVVALPADARELIALHRRSGALLWRRPMPEGVDYAVGRRGAGLVVAGARAVACVDLGNGRERWRKAIGGSTGRGVLRGPEVLIPCDRKIQRLRIADGADLGAMQAQTMDDLPLGNLYVRGDQLLVAGPERLYALVGADAVFAELRAQLARQPTAEAYARRGGMLAGQGRHGEAVADLREVWKRQRGSAAEGAARARLTAELYRAAEQDPWAADRCLAEARELAASDKERAEAAWRIAQASEWKGDTQGALALYAAQLTSPDARLRCGPNWEASARLLAAHRIRALLARDEAGLRALLEKPAAQELTRLGPQAEGAALVEVATLFAGTAAGKAAALQAAQTAAGRNDFGIAAAILQRALALSPASFRAELAGELARLYERMKWPRGVARLREEWPRLGGGAPLPGFLATSATNVAPPAGASMPLPPWRLRWKKGPNMNGSIIVPSGLLYAQLSGSVGQVHVVNFGCLSLETGMPRWQNSGSSTFTVPQSSLDDCLASVMTDRIQLREWEAGQLIPGLTGSLDIWSGAVISNDVFCNSFSTNAYGAVFAALSSEVSVRVVARGNVLMGEDMLTGTCAWMLVWNEPDPGVWRGGAITVVGTMLAQDGAPAVFPQTGHFLARTGDNREHLALDPLTGAVLSRRSLEVANNRDRAVWTGHAFGVWSVTNENGRLIVKDPTANVTHWKSPPDLAIVNHQVMARGTVLVETQAGELLLLDGANGKVLSRSGDARFNFDWATGAGDLVIASRRGEEGTYDVMMLDPTIGTPVFRGTISWSNPPIMVFNAALTNLCLVLRRDSNREITLQVINGRGETANGWGLPLPADRRNADRCFVRPFFTRDLIVVQDSSSSDILAYEHDPGEGGKK